jgi:hypothetical protein
MKNVTATICLTIALLLGSVGVSASAEMRPLLEVMQEQTPKGALYGLIRCSALHYASSSKVLTYERKEEAKTASEKGGKIANKFNFAANLFANKSNLPMTAKQILANIENIMVAYDELWKRNYANTGKDWGKLTYQDLKACSDIREALPK